MARRRFCTLGYRRAHVWVLAQNSCAIRFYCATGFVHDALLKNRSNWKAWPCRCAVMRSHLMTNRIYDQGMAR